MQEQRPWLQTAGLTEVCHSRSPPRSARTHPLARSTSTPVLTLSPVPVRRTRAESCCVQANARSSSLLLSAASL